MTCIAGVITTNAKVLTAPPAGIVKKTSEIDTTSDVLITT